MQPCAIPVDIGHLVLIPGRQVATAPRATAFAGRSHRCAYYFLITIEGHVLSANGQNNNSGTTAIRGSSARLPRIAAVN